MPRPRKIAPNGETRQLNVIVSDELHDELRQESARTGISIGEIVRRRLASNRRPEARAS